MAVKLAKVWGVSPDKVLATRADLVMAALQYEVFVENYRSVYIEMNRGAGA